MDGFVQEGVILAPLHLGVIEPLEQKRRNLKYPDPFDPLDNLFAVCRCQPEQTGVIDKDAVGENVFAIFPVVFHQIEYLCAL
jgi:hypothetical protein